VRLTVYRIKNYTPENVPPNATTPPKNKKNPPPKKKPPKPRELPTKKRPPTQRQHDMNRGRTILLKLPKYCHCHIADSARPGAERGQRAGELERATSGETYHFSA